MKHAGGLSRRTREICGGNRSMGILSVGLSMLHVSVISITIIIITTKQLRDESGLPRFLSPGVEGVISDNLFADSSDLCNESNALDLRVVFNSLKPSGKFTYHQV
jgi:hypothetical protein